MPTPQFNSKPSSYDPRWFIWTIVFLVVAGVSLVSYIVFSDTGVAYNPMVPMAHSAHKVPASAPKK